ncbi:Plug domain-containing protein, partial [bacterium]|nr:Plug domain-containing protein [bacterium]
MQTKSVIMLILFCSHPEPGSAQSQKSQIWRIPVSPYFNAGDTESEEQSNIQPDASRSRDFDELVDPLQSDETGPSEKRLPTRTIRNSVTTGDLMARIGILGSGKESGRWGGGRLSLRGHPGDEPTVSLNGLLVSSGFSGAHSEELIPAIAVERIRAYPFFPSLNLPQMGISGGYDFELIYNKQAAAQESAIRIEFPAAFHLANRTQISCADSGCLQFSWAGSFFRGATDVVDDHNTPQESRDDTNEAIKFKDVSRLSAVANYSADHGHGSQSDSTFLVGAESRSTSGLPLASVSEFNRLKRRLLLLTHRTSHLSPGDGWKATLRLGARQESALFQQDLMNNSLQIRDDKRDESFLSAQGNLSFPFVGIEQNHLFLLNTSLEASSFKSDVGLVGIKGSPAVATDSAFENSKTEGLLHSLSAASGVRAEIGNSDVLKVLFNLSSNRFSLERVCGVFSPQVLCEEKKKNSSRNGLGGHFEWRHLLSKDAFFYVQGGQLQRLPRPIEVAGRPDGVVANP